MKVSLYTFTDLNFSFELTVFPNLGLLAYPSLAGLGSLNALKWRLRAAYEEQGGAPETNPCRLSITELFGFTWGKWRSANLRLEGFRDPVQEEKEEEEQSTEGNTLALDQIKLRSDSDRNPISIFELKDADREHKIGRCRSYGQVVEVDPWGWSHWLLRMGSLYPPPSMLMSKTPVFSLYTSKFFSICRY